MHPDEISKLLRRAVTRRVLPPGQPLNQDDLAKRLGVSRIPLREALRTLAAEGLIVIRPGVGAVVTELSKAEIEELYDLRLLLEPALAAATVQRAGGADIDQLADVTRRMAVHVAAKEADEWSTLNYVFLRQLHEISGKRHQVRIVTQVLNLVEPYSRIYVHVLGALAESQTQLSEMLDALTARDAHRLRVAQEASIQDARDRLVAEMATTNEPSDPLHRLLDISP